MCSLFLLEYFDTIVDSDAASFGGKVIEVSCFLAKGQLTGFFSQVFAKLVHF